MKDIEKLLSNLDDSERSRLLYLISALQVDSKRSSELINVMFRLGNSIYFNKILNELQNSSNIIYDAKLLREKML